MNDKVFFILYVADQDRSTDFYETILGSEPVLHVPGMTEFALTDTTSLGLMPEKGTESFLSDKVPKPATGNGIPRCELYLFTESPSASIRILEQAGGTKISDPEPRPWGDTVAYGSDPDGHILAFAGRSNRQ